jgi:hypothetical protein
VLSKRKTGLHDNARKVQVKRLPKLLTGKLLISAVGVEFAIDVIRSDAAIPTGVSVIAPCKIFTI